MCSYHFINFFLIFAFISVCLCTKDEERLVRDLFRGYNKFIRPVRNMTDKVHVKFGLTFVQLINVDEKNQVMKANVWLEFQWHDYQLQWDEGDYQGIKKLRLPPDKIWKPDIVLFNNADGKYEVRYKCNVLISSDGSVTWIPPALYQSSCTIDVTYFPFDQQTCLMKFGSWTFNGDQVSLELLDNKNYVSLSDYYKSGTWDIIEVPAYLNVYEGFDHPTETDITFYITIRRKTLFYTVNLILPTVLISFLCILEFYLPAEAGEKVTLGISILLSLVLFLLLVSKILPPTSLVLPLIAKYLLFTFIMNVICILMTVMIINWNFRGPKTHHMPKFVRVVFLKILPSILLMKRPKKTRLRWMMERQSMRCNKKLKKMVVPIPAANAAAYSDFKNNQELIEMHNFHSHNHHHHQHHHHQHHHHQHHHPSCSINRNEEISNGNNYNNGDDIYETVGTRRQSGMSLEMENPIIKDALSAVDFVAEHLRNEDLYIQTREDWKYVAMVIDRLLLFVFFFVTTSGATSILLDAPHIFEYVDQDKIIETFR